ncbi:MAG: SRPBCC domain-containing protein [Chloroflexota bacterium]
MTEDIIFKALADGSRRSLLDQLKERDGQSLTELEQHLPMTRFGVMKHLRILEDAGLITTEKVGREKRHYLNPIPIQLAYDRWVSKYARPLTTKMTDLKYILENNMNKTLTHRYQIFIQSTPEKIWEALTSGEISPAYYFGFAVSSNWETGGRYAYEVGGNSALDGEIIEIDPPKKLIQTFNAHWEPDAEALGPSKVTWLIEPEGSGLVSKLTLIHEELKDVPFANGIIRGWSQILSGLKTLIETGEPLKFE